jgi:hypothetical protein
MSLKTVSALLVFAWLSVACVAGVSPALAAREPGTAWSLQVLALPTHFSSARNVVCEERPGAHEVEYCDHYTIVPFNVGTRRAAGTITVVDTLPAGLTVIGTPSGENVPGSIVWTCTTGEASGQAVVTCETAGEEGEGIKPLTPAAGINIDVRVDPSAHGTLINRAEVVGGGASSAAMVETPTPIGPDATSFAPEDFHTGALDPAGGPATEAGAHPGGFTASFTFPSAYSIKPPGAAARAYPVQDVKQIVTELPAGLIGDALSAAQCPLYDVTNLKENQRQCPAASRVGRLVLVEPSAAQTELIIFNVTPEHGYAAEFAVYLPEVARAAILYAKLVGSGPDARVRVISAPQNSIVANDGVSLSFFGNPSLHAGPSILEENSGGSPLIPTAFFTSPSNCEASGFTSTVYADTWQNPGRVEADGEPDLSDPNWKRATATAPPVTGCEALQFHPSLTFRPESGHQGADEPAGYESILRVPQNGDPSGLATPPLKTTVVTLPAGVAISPAAAVGLVGCEFGPQGIGLEGETESSQPGHCPEASKVGEVEAQTPVLEEPLKGSIFVAEPPCGGSGQPACTEEAAETGGVFAVYLELGNENSGVHVKLKGKIEVGGNGHHNNLAPNQVRTTFAETPQAPVSELKLKFNGGPSAALANPQSCGTFASVAELEPWSHTPAPGENAGTPNVTLNPSFSISGCEDKFAPSFSAGTTNPQAGHYSPLTVTFSRQDREQDLSGITVNMPAGLTGRLAGIPECSEGDANAGSCPASTRVGSATAAVGSGSAPLWQGGTVFFTGPYKGAPFGLSVIVPAKAGPYDLGNIVVRAALFVNPRTAQVSVVSDPLPQSIDGVPLRVKTVNTTIDREAFTLNPTNCAEQTLSASISSTQGIVAPVASRFQAAGCSGLKFSPVLSASTAATSSKANGASLNVKIAYPSGAIGTQSWFKETKLDFPKQLPARLTTLQKACLASVFEANPAACPAGSLIGHATVHTPVLPVPLSGPIYFVSHGGAKFPDAVFVLQGDGVTIQLTGETFVNGKTGITSATFRGLPDVPFENIEVTIPSGPASEFAGNLPASAKGSFCGQKLTMPTRLTAQNGAEIRKTTSVGVTGCSTRFSVSARAKKGRTLSLSVYVPVAGKLTVSGRGLNTTTKSSLGRETLTLKLHIGKRGRFKSEVKLVFSPRGSKRQTTSFSTRL